VNKEKDLLLLVLCFSRNIDTFSVEIFLQIFEPPEFKGKEKIRKLTVLKNCAKQFKLKRFLAEGIMK